jgi:hypothetical protein
MVALNSLCFAAHTNGCLFIPMTEPGIGTNSNVAIEGAYSSVQNSNIWATDLLIESNASAYDGIYNWARYVNARLLNTNNGYTIDGVHFNSAAAISTNGWQVMQGAANTFQKNPNFVIPDFDGNIPVNTRSNLW